MSNFKEIVTKAVVGKGKKTTIDNHVVELSTNPSTILGCWIINHNFNGVKDGKVEYTIEKTIAAELVGDAKIKIGVEPSNDFEDPIDEEIDDIKEDFIK